MLLLLLLLFHKIVWRLTDIYYINIEKKFILRMFNLIQIKMK